MQYKVPKNVQREDKILWFITLKQFIILAVGFGISYLLFVRLNDNYILNQIQQILIWLPAMIGAAFAFLKVKDVTLFQFILLIIEQTIFRSSRRYWMQGEGTPFVSRTQNVRIQTKKKEAASDTKEDVSKDKIKNLAKVLDGEKSVYQKDHPNQKAYQ